MLPYLCTAVLCIISNFTWGYPQPVYSSGLLVTYGSQSLVEANADYRSYDLSVYPDRCGLSGISPAGLGRIAYVRTAGSDWIGPCLVVDAVGKVDAYGSIYDRHEIAEVSRSVAEELGFQYGSEGFIWFGLCPPNPDSLWPQPQPYSPPLVWDTGEPDGHRSWGPYPSQQIPIDCPKSGEQESEYDFSGWYGNYTERRGIDPGDAGELRLPGGYFGDPVPN